MSFQLRPPIILRAPEGAGGRSYPETIETIGHTPLVLLRRASEETGCTILGILGEAPKLEAAESLDIVKACVRRAKFPFIVGVSAPRRGPEMSTHE